MDQKVHTSEGRGIIDRLLQAMGVSTQVELSRRIGQAPTIINRAIRTGKVPDIWLYRVAYLTGLSVDWLRTGKGQRWHVQTLDFQIAREQIVTYGKTKPQLVPVVSWVQAGAMTSAVDPLPYAGAAEDYLSISVKGKNCIALRVRGDSMLPEFREGDVLVVDPEQRDGRPGDYVVVKDDDGEEATFKQLVRKQGVLVLHPLNIDKYPEMPYDPGKHRIVGKVIRLLRSY